MAIPVQDLRALRQDAAVSDNVVNLLASFRTRTPVAATIGMIMAAARTPATAARMNDTR